MPAALGWCKQNAQMLNWTMPRLHQHNTQVRGIKGPNFQLCALPTHPVLHHNRSYEFDTVASE